MPLGMEVGLSPGDFELDGGTQLPPTKWVQPPSNFRPMSIVTKRLYVSFRISLGTEVGLGLGDTVLDGDAAPPPLQFVCQCPLWPNGWID